MDSYTETVRAGIVEWLNREVDGEEISGYALERVVIYLRACNLSSDDKTAITLYDYERVVRFND